LELQETGTDLFSRHLWQERFHSFLMDEDYLLATVRYVERNPVAARLCESAGQWPWSSARAHLRGQDDGLVRAKPMLDRINDWQAYLSNDVENHQTDSIRRHTRTGRPLGTAEFVHNLEQVTGKPLAPKRPKIGIRGQYTYFVFALALELERIKYTVSGIPLILKPGLKIKDLTPVIQPLI
jgi:hypothetical protein